jgi:glucosamine 6-phosphate synthetase-like amidotransferase/phosphosugar isomerase protein
MCGVIGFISEKSFAGLGKRACKLLQMLEYRGYDSTGGVIQNKQKDITLLKDVGAPEKVAYELGIDKLSGNIFCGQVRWATFGIVNKENAQPHEVNCKIHIYGAHNGNITNCHQLKDWLTSQGHEILSDNDGEMLVHTIEHYFAEELRFKDQKNDQIREEALKNAILKGYKKITGSFAAVVVDPVAERAAVIKAGSSLYLGQGQNSDSGKFVVASSDLASVLQMTKILIPIKEKQFAIFNPQSCKLYDIRNGNELEVQPQRSLLKVKETRLQHPFKYFMEQEIHSQVKNTLKLITLFTGGDKVTQILSRNEKESSGLYQTIKHEVEQLSRLTDEEQLRARTTEFFESPSVKCLIELIIKNQGEEFSLKLDSGFSSFLEDLRKIISESECNTDPHLILKFIDSIFELENIKEIETRMAEFVNIIGEARRKGRSVYILACGTSFHAAKTAPLFFNEIAGISVTPLLPGEFRAQCTKSLNEDDIVIGISQSGETKDLIDVFNFVEEKYPSIKRICILNNTNSTLAMEKSDLYVPLFCGPEIAVPATKSFLNQLLVLYALAINVRKYLEIEAPELVKDGKDYSFHFEEMKKIPDLVERTIKTCTQDIDAIAGDIFLRPSMHILATRILGIAKEGALKIREIVLNHTEGFEGSEFKHGPNTILGINTVFGLDSLSQFLGQFEEILNFILESEDARDMRPRGLLRMFKAIADYSLKDQKPHYLSKEESNIFDKIFENYDLFSSLYDNYPLLFITTPREIDINLTISQINTHKIRGANVYLIAEDNNDLREAVSVAPTSMYPYKFGYITIPKTNSIILPIFSISVVLQMLAFSMSIKKMQFLDKLEIANHGVHPDVPKNVSKSITVD